MNLEAIAIQSRPNEHETLALAVRAVARSLAADLDYDELCAALGISLVAVAGPVDSSPALWLTYARDSFLAPACRLFGLQVRDLHPPDVGVDMLWADEFAQHFQLSYAPLVRRALEHEQPVLAWRGWEGRAAPFWGIITGVDDDGLWGVVPGSTGRVLLSGPALQCYVVEHYERRTPSPAEMLAATLTHTQAYLTRPEALASGTEATESHFTTGPAAYGAWSRWLAARRPRGGQDAARDAFRAYVRRLCAARLSAMRFLQRMDAVTSPDAAALLDAIIGDCDALVQELTPFGLAEELSTFWRTPEGHQELQESISAAEAADQRIAGYVGRLLDADGAAKAVGIRG